MLIVIRLSQPHSFGQHANRTTKRKTLALTSPDVTGTAFLTTLPAWSGHCVCTNFVPVSL